MEQKNMMISLEFSKNVCDVNSITNKIQKTLFLFLYQEWRLDDYHFIIAQ